MQHVATEMNRFDVRGSQGTIEPRSSIYDSMQETGTWQGLPISLEKDRITSEIMQDTSSARKGTTIMNQRTNVPLSGEQKACAGCLRVHLRIYFAASAALGAAFFTFLTVFFLGA
eukprot:scaffold90343_cov35-Attheya_sp.AAC.1